MRRLTAHPAPPGQNSLWDWHRRLGFWKVARNFALIYGARFVPWLPLKNALYRAAGMRVGARVSVGLMAMFDVFFPELITLEDDCIVGYNATVLAHEFLRDEYRTGPVVVGAGAVIGANATVLAGVRIGRGAVVSAMSLVNRDVPDGALAGGVPARVLREEATPRNGDARPGGA